VIKFSILLPTRNRLEYLKLAVESVLRQDHDDWQLVVSDNDSEQDIQGYVGSLGDPRIVYGRTDRLVPVTENWNRALALSEGEYVIMLGDDDALLDGYLRSMDELISRFEQPDVIYTKALLFTYPGVDPARPSGWLMDHGCGEFFAGASEPFVLEHDRALGLVRGAMSFRLRYDFNAQFALISRRLIDSLRAYGDFYQSDFPDYYSMNAAFLSAERIVVDPAPRVVIGVTPKSYGYFHVNDKEGEGRAFLGGGEAAPATGTNINVGWLSAMSALERGVGGDFSLSVDRRRYRFVQAAYVYARYRAGVSRDGELARLEQELPARERWAYRAANAALGIVDRLVPARRRTAMIGLFNRLVGQLPPIDPAIVEGRYADVLEVCAATTPSPSAGAAQPAGK
jgi:glycosyltransferase involved in cell wall biosynthesis